MLSPEPSSLHISANLMFTSGRRLSRSKRETLVYAHLAGLFPFDFPLGARGFAVRPTNYSNFTGWNA